MCKDQIRAKLCNLLFSLLYFVEQYQSREKTTKVEKEAILIVIKLVESKHLWIQW